MYKRLHQCVLILPLSGSCWTGWCESPPGWANCREKSLLAISLCTMRRSLISMRWRGTEVRWTRWKTSGIIDYYHQERRLTAETWSASTYHLMDGAVESIVLCQDEENDKGHVDVMRISFLYVVKDLEYGQHLRQTAGKEKESNMYSGLTSARLLTLCGFLMPWLYKKDMFKTTGALSHFTFELANRWGVSHNSGKTTLVTLLILHGSSNQRQTTHTKLGKNANSLGKEAIKQLKITIKHNVYTFQKGIIHIILFKPIY